MANILNKAEVNTLTSRLWYFNYLFSLETAMSLKDKDR